MQWGLAASIFREHAHNFNLVPNLIIDPVTTPLHHHDTHAVNVQYSMESHNGKFYGIHPLSTHKFRGIHLSWKYASSVLFKVCKVPCYIFIYYESMQVPCYSKYARFHAIYSSIMKVCKFRAIQSMQGSVVFIYYDTYCKVIVVLIASVCL